MSPTSARVAVMIVSSIAAMTTLHCVYNSYNFH